MVARWRAWVAPLSRCHLGAIAPNTRVQAPAFDPASLPCPLVGERIYASHGRGVFLITELMDEVHHAKGGTEIWMRKRR